MKSIAAAIVLLSVSLTSDAGTLKNPKDVKEFSDRIMSLVGTGNLDQAFNEIKGVAVVTPTEIDSVAVQSKAQREQYGQRYGASNGFEFISQKAVGKSLLRLQYIEKTDKHALPWTFYFYKAQDGWALNTFNWNDQFQQLFMLN